MKLGIGISTFNRPLHLKWCLSNIKKYTSVEYKVFIYNDGDPYSDELYKEITDEIQSSNFIMMESNGERKGVAYSKNMCIYNLRDCDNIVLFDDDCTCINDGWAEYFIESGYNHSCYMNDKYQRVYSGEKHLSYNLCAGAFIFITKKVIETVGYFNPKYGLYGYEHAAYCHRIYQAGLTPSRFITLKDTDQYIHSLDIDGIAGYEFLNHKRSITDADRSESLVKNNPIYHEETTSHRIKYDFIP